MSSIPSIGTGVSSVGEDGAMEVELQPLQEVEKEEDDDENGEVVPPPVEANSSGNNNPTTKEGEGGGSISSEKNEGNNTDDNQKKEEDGGQVVYDMEEAKAFAARNRQKIGTRDSTNHNLSTYSWLEPTNDDGDDDNKEPEQPKQPLEEEDNKMKAMEIAGPPPKLFQQAPTNGFLLTSWDSFVVDWLYTILIGILVVSFWRGGWVLLDVLSCDQPKTAGMVNGDSFCFLGSMGTVHDVRHTTSIRSLVAGYILLMFGLTLLNLGLWRPVKLYVKDAPNKLKLHKSICRIAIVLCLGEGTLCIWRGIWYLLDYYIHPEDATISSALTAGFGGLLCLILQATASLLAPPSIFLMDGPAHLPPPIGVTIVTSYRSIAQPASVSRERNQNDPLWLIVLDLGLSYVVLPIGVVGFWRGIWALLDIWLWGITLQQSDVNYSILWSFLLGLALLLIGSEDVVQHFNPEKTLSSPAMIDLANRIFGRLRTLLLAFGTVNFWRAIWLFWDECLGNSHLWSCLLSHLLGIVGLLLLGCLSCITAPPSTLGVDAVAHPESSDEPLFHNVPVPAEALYLLSIAQRPEAILKGLDMPEPLMEPNVLSSRDVRVNQSIEMNMSPAILSAVDSLLVQEDHIFRRTTTPVAQQQQQEPNISPSPPPPIPRRSPIQRFVSAETSATIQATARHQSSSILRLSERHMNKRQKSQFYRNR